MRQCDVSRSPNRGWLSARCRGSRVAIARMMARSEGEFESVLSAMDVTVSKNSIKAVRLGLRFGGTAHKKGRRRTSQPVVQSRVSWRRFAAGAAVGGYRRGEREGVSSPVVVAMWRVSLARGCAAMGSNQMPLSMARSVSSSLSFLTRRSLPILMAGIFCHSMSL